MLKTKRNFGSNISVEGKSKTLRDIHYDFLCINIIFVSLSKTFWEQERVDKQLSKKQTFVDLGCGNGLLVHLLAQYGVSNHR